MQHLFRSLVPVLCLGRYSIQVKDRNIVIYWAAATKAVEDAAFDTYLVVVGDTIRLGG
jgi:hypothetical protein